MGVGGKTAASRKPKGRSNAQKSAAFKNLKRGKENQEIVPYKPPPPKDDAKPPRDWKHAFQKSQRRLRDLLKQQKRIRQENQDLKTANQSLRRDFENAKLAGQVLNAKAIAIAAHMSSQREKARQAALKAHAEKKELKNQNRALQKRVARAATVMSRAIARVKTKPNMWRLTQKGIYTVQARRLARIIVSSGCPRKNVGKIMSEVALTFGIKIDRSMSARTVSRAVLEGGIAASTLQLPYEIGLNQSLTVSADSTSNRGVNFEASHIAMRVPDYRDGQLEIDPASTPKVRSVGVHSTLDHGIDEAVAGWETRIGGSMDAFNASPLAARLNKKYTYREFLRILNGANGDHAAVEKGTARGLKEAKKEAVIQDLGEAALARKEFDEAILYLAAWNTRKIIEAGGLEAWNQLAPSEQTARDRDLVHRLVKELGEAEFDALSDEERRSITLFFWGGCCMHKDQNSFKGGNTEMMQEHARLGLTPPIILANKANAAVLKRVLEPASTVPDELTDLEQAAFEASTRGGVKTCAIAGAIFHNKDGKIGQGDRHVDFFTAKTGKPHPRFPPTNQTRFGSHGLAAAELIKYRELYLEFLQVIEWSKATPALTNIELNLRRALEDVPTLEELCAMILYQQCITHPYMRVVRGPGTEETNLLDLGPLHRDVRDHIQSILDDPSLLFSSDISHVSGSLDGKEWEDPDAITAVLALMPKLPNLQAITLSFFRGALNTWVRFSDEFAPGGLIDEASATELQLVWMPSTNDANEGSLGGYRVMMRTYPRLTLHQYNAMAMYRRNNTQDFMDAMLIEEDHRDLRVRARILDASGLEKKRTKELAEFRMRLAQMKKEKELAKRRQQAKELGELLQIRVFTSLAEVRASKTTVKKLDEQLKILRLRGVPGIKPNSQLKVKADKQVALEEALKVFLLTPDTYPAPLVPSIEPEVVVQEDWSAEDEREMEE